MDIFMVGLRWWSAVFVGRVKPASSVENTKNGGLHPMCANQNQKDLFSAFGTLILERLATAGAFLS
jgi:hypothetical protein